MDGMGSIKHLISGRIIFDSGFCAVDSSPGGRISWARGGKVLGNLDTGSLA